MVQKLYSLVGGNCSPDNPDSLQHQEVLLPGHLYGSIVKEKLSDWLVSIKTQIKTDLRRQPHIVDFFDKKYVLNALKKTQGASDIGKKLDYFLATGNLVTNSGLDLQQVSGYTIVAEKLNFYRYISHFRSIHRGSFFAELKTTTVRKLLPESWGFLCPVHTPDGSPCGLLNHLSHTCQIIVKRVESSSISKFISSFGVKRSFEIGQISDNANDIMCIQLDGKVLGYCTRNMAEQIAESLRYCKVQGLNKVCDNVRIFY